MGGFVEWLLNTIEGTIDHRVPGIHHVNEYAANPLGPDLAFLASGIGLALAGWALIRSARSAPAPR